MKDDLILKTEGLSKRYCRSLRRSLFYGLCDLGKELTVSGGAKPELRREEFWAVDGISMELRRGECVGLVGKNGAGKTTLLKLINGLIKPDRGTIGIRGRVGALIALGAGFNPILTGRENIYVNGAVLGCRKREIDRAFDEIVAFSGVESFIDAPVQSYSSGMQVRLGFAIAAKLTRPDLLLLDEVLAVGDAAFHTKCINTIREMQREGVAIILVSHNMHNLFRYCDRGIYMKVGRVVARGEIVEVSNLYLQDQSPENALEEVGNVPTGSPFQLDEIEVRSSENLKVSKIDSLEEISILVPWHLERSYAQARIRLEIAIDDHLGLFHQSISQPIEFIGGDAGDSGSFVAKVKAIGANSGRLNIGVSMWSSEDGGELLGWSHNNFLLVENHLGQAGRCVLDVDWKNV